MDIMDQKWIYGSRLRDVRNYVTVSLVSRKQRGGPNISNSQGARHAGSGDFAKFKSKGASHISFDFPQQKGLGIPQLIPHAPADGVELMVKLLRYDASERISAREAMRHPYFPRYP